MIRTPVELEDRVRVIAQEHLLEEGIVKKLGPLGCVWVELDKHEEGKWTLFIPADLKVIV